MRERMQNRRSEAAREVLNTLHDRAVVRHLEASGFDARVYLTDDELRQWEAAQAVENELLMTQHNVGKVVVEVWGGVAEVTSNPERVEVEIIDHDNDAALKGAYERGLRDAVHFATEEA